MTELTDAVGRYQENLAAKRAKRPLRDAFIYSIPIDEIEARRQRELQANSIAPIEQGPVTGFLSDAAGLASDVLSLAGRHPASRGVNIGLDVDDAAGRFGLDDISPFGPASEVLENASYGFGPVSGRGMTTTLDPRVADVADITPQGIARRLVRDGAPFLAQAFLHATPSPRKFIEEMEVPFTTNIRDIFDEKFFGTDAGEGALSFGWGINMAENPKVSGTYAANFEYAGRPAFILESEIDDDVVARMLDWDAPLSEQPESVRQALQLNVFKDPNAGRSDQWVVSAFGKVVDGFPTKRAANEALESTMTGERFYRGLSLNSGDATASRQLNELGIPGIRYFDQQSRELGEGSRNITLFSPDDISQVKLGDDIIYARPPKKTVEDAMETFRANRSGIKPTTSGVDVSVAESKADTMMPTSELMKLNDPNVPVEKIRAQERPYLDNLKRQIEEQGLREPLEIRSSAGSEAAAFQDEIIWEGNHRLAVLDELGVDEIPVRYTDMAKPTTSGKGLLGAPTTSGVGKYPVKAPFEGAETKRLYNASTVDFAPSSNPMFPDSQWLDPHVSAWVDEVAGGTGYEGDIADITTDLLYLGDEPTGWIESIVGRKVGKNNPTLEDVRKHGRLNIIDADMDSDIYKVGDYSETQEVTNLYGDRLKFWESNIYDEGNVYTGEGRLVDMPVGPEPDDFITKDSVDVSYSLTGDELVDFIKENDPKLYERLASRTPTTSGVGRFTYRLPKDDSGELIDIGKYEYNLDVASPPAESTSLKFTPKAGWSERVPAPKEDGVIYRGMSEAEYKSFLETGEIKSQGRMNIGKAQEGLTYFSTSADNASGYATGVSTFDKNAKGYVVAIRDPGTAVNVHGTSHLEKGIPGTVTKDQVVGVYEGVPSSWAEGSDIVHAFWRRIDKPTTSGKDVLTKDRTMKRE